MKHDYCFYVLSIYIYLSIKRFYNYKKRGKVEAKIFCIVINISNQNSTRTISHQVFKVKAGRINIVNLQAQKN